MKKNIGNAERVIRAVVGVFLIALALMGKTPWGWIGLIPLATAIIGWCPPYALLGISTCKNKV